MVFRNALDDLVMFPVLVADLRSLESEFFHVPSVEDFRQDGHRLTNEYVEASLVRSLLEFVVQIMEGFQKKPQHVDRGSVVVACVKPWV